MAATPPDSRRPGIIRRNALLLGAVAVALYFGSMAMLVWRGSHG